MFGFEEVYLDEVSVCFQRWLTTPQGCNSSCIIYVTVLSQESGSEMLIADDVGMPLSLQPTVYAMMQSPAPFFMASMTSTFG